MLKSRTLLGIVVRLAAPLCVAASALANTNDYSIGISFASDQLLEDYATTQSRSTLDPAEVAGVPSAAGIPNGRQANWNNAVDSITGAAFSGAYGTRSTMIDLVADDRGTSVVTTATVTWQANGTWSGSGSRGAAETNGWRFMTNAATYADHKLLNGYLDTTAAANPTLITISNIPTALTSKGYHVIVYGNGGSRTSARGGSVRVLDPVSGLALSPYLLFSTLVDPQTHTRDLGVNHTDLGTYLLFTNLAASTLQVEATIAVNPNTGTPRAPVAAVQLIAANLSEPIVGSATANGQFAYVTITDLGAAAVDTNSVQVKLDGATTNSPVSVVKNGITTTVTYNILADKGTFFPSGSAHTNLLVFRDLNGNSFTNTRTFTVAAYTTVDANLRASAADTSKPGFRSRVYQMPVPRGPTSIGQTTVGINAVPEAERQLARGYLDLLTEPREPYFNSADLTEADANGWFTHETVLNWDQVAGLGVGFFNANGTPSMPDSPIPGIALGALNGNDNIVAEILTYLQLQPGLYRIGVNSDDGFQFSIGRSPGDLRGQIISSRGGSGDTMFDIAITQAGFYPARLLWWEGTGGANLEFYSADLATGARTLINDTTSSIKAYRESATTFPYVSKILPTAGQANNIPTADVTVQLTDGTVPVDAGTFAFTVNGVNVPSTKTGAATTATRTGSLSNLLPGGANTARLVYGFTVGGTQTLVTNTWTFTVGGTTGGDFGPAVVTIPPGNRVPLSTVNGSPQGFKILRVHQIDRSLDANQGNGGRVAGQGGDGNRMPRMEIQLNNGYQVLATGEPYTNRADLSLALPDGSFDVFTLNLNALTGNAGAFTISPYTDQRAPGMPGSGTSQTGQDNAVWEIATYMDLKAGAYLMSVNSDDGFVLYSAPDVHDTLGTLVGMWNVGGGSANPASRFICFVILEDGIYPFRLLWWQGGGGGNIEMSSIDYASGRSLLINDVNYTQAITSYTAYSGPARAWAKFAVYPMRIEFQNQHQQSGPGPITMRVGAGGSVDLLNDAPTIRVFADGFGAVFTNLNGTTPGALLNGVAVTVTTNAAPGGTEVRYRPATPLPSGSTNTASFIYEGTTNSWTFVVQTYTNVPAGTAVATSLAGTRGFQVRVAQSAAARPGGNNPTAAETQLAGTPTNIATLGPLPNGAYPVTGIINYNVTKIPGNTPADTGNFTPTLNGLADLAIPGLPGTNTTGAARFENWSAEIFAYLDLPAGYHKLGLNGDDGTTVKIGTPGVTNGIVLYTDTRAAGNRDIPFSFYVPEAGLYPVRFIHYQGGGGGNLELFSYGSNNRKIPLNADDPEAIKAYQDITGGGNNPTLSVVRNSNGSITLNFQGTLQSTANLVGQPPNWQPVTPTGAGTHTVNPGTAAGGLFFRAVQ